MTVDTEFNTETSRAIVASELDAWAVEHADAARALKALILDLIRTRKIAGDKLVMRELKALEV